MWQQKVQQILKTKDLRNRIFFVLFVLVIFRLTAHIPLPGVNPQALESFFAGNQFFSLVDVFAGGGLSRMSVVMLGVGPYITASIIMQLAGMVIPKMEELQKEGASGQNKINQWTRYLTVPLAAMQAYGMLALFTRSGSGGQVILDNSPLGVLTIIITAVAGSMFLTWLGELITEKNVGNGISILIFAGIIAYVPESVFRTVATYDSSQFFNILLFLAVSLAVVAGVVFITSAVRNIPIKYARKIIGSKTMSGGNSNLPIKINQAGVIPIIFAISILLFPTMIANFLQGTNSPRLVEIANNTIALFQNQTFYAVVYFVLVFAFTFFYTSVTFKPDQVSENIQRQGGFIPGIRPGRETKEYLQKISNRITLAGAIFLGVIAILPLIMQNVLGGTSNLSVGGTSLLIIVAVALEIINQIESQMFVREYDKL